jgi:wyosine [tRNA(Phe)-imidazoG37] synthetase (radical SAM superfamily)
MTDTATSFYCSQKFWWLSIDLAKRQTLSCCSADPVSVDMAWLAQHPGQLFNTPHLQQERTMMLQNQPVASCNTACWQPESQGKSSRRLVWKSNVLAETDVQASPTELNIIVGNDCNMTCVYCCKQYSSAWLRDLTENGPYHTVDTGDDRFEINNVDRILLRISQKALNKSDSTQQLRNEIRSMLLSSTITRVSIVGGEPFLYLGLAELIKSIPSHIKVIIQSGLGVDSRRLVQELNKLPTEQIEVGISAETTDQLYEFVRHGNTWKRLVENIQILRDLSVPYTFLSVVSNLTIHGLPKFVQYAEDASVKYYLCNDPDFLSINVLDPASKDQILQSADQFPTGLKFIVVNSIAAEPTEPQRRNLNEYVNEFSKRRNILPSTILPQSFMEWMAK